MDLSLLGFCPGLVFFFPLSVWFLVFSLPPFDLNFVSCSLGPHHRISTLRAGGLPEGQVGKAALGGGGGVKEVGGKGRGGKGTATSNVDPPPPPAPIQSSGEGKKQPPEGGGWEKGRRSP